MGREEEREDKGNFGVLKVPKERFEKQETGRKHWYLELKTRAQLGSDDIKTEM